MSDSDDQVTKKKQKVNDDRSAGCSKMLNTCAQRLHGTQSTDSNQSTQTTQEIGDIKIETNNDQDTSNSRQNVRVRVDTKGAEYNRLYRLRHREEINQRRRQQRKNIPTINEQNAHETSNNQLSSNSHTQRQQRYYERHKEELNKRKRDSRIKISQSNKRKRDRSILKPPPATAAERNRKYRERNKQKINERRRDSRLLQQNVEGVQTECIINNIDPMRICEVLMN